MFIKDLSLEHEPVKCLDNPPNTTRVSKIGEAMVYGTSSIGLELPSNGYMGVSDNSLRLNLSLGF